MLSSRKKEALFASGIVAIAIAVAAVLIALRPKPEIAEPVRKPLDVEVMAVQRQTQPIILHAQGTVQPRTRTDLVSEVRGQVVEVSPAFHAGGFFHAGDVLLRIDDRQYVSAVKSAEATVASARSQLAQEQGRAEVAYQDWVKAGKPQYRSDQAKDLALRKPQVAEAQATLDFALAELARVQGDLEHTIIRAPYDGLVQDKAVDIGQYVTAGAPLGQTFAVDVVEIRLPIPENRLDFLILPESYRSRPTTDIPPTPLPVTLSLTVNGHTEHWQGELVRTEGVLDERSRVLHLVARVTDPYGLRPGADPSRPDLRIGSFVEATITGKPIEHLVKLPRHVLRAGNRIWLVGNDGHLVDRKVDVLVSEGDTVYITGGLDDGDRVCLTPVGNVLAGTAVQVVTPAATESPKAPAS